MGEFLSQYWGALLVGLLVAAAVVGAIVKMIRDRRKGSSCGCGCGCSGCPSSDMCHKS